MVDGNKLQRILSECEEKLTLLETTFGRELEKPLSTRRTSFLRFLDRERSVYAFAVSILRELQSN
jgi:hypothetical protein